MKLHTSGFGSNPARVHMFLNEIGLDIERVNINLNHGEHKQPAYAALNSSKTVPALELDDGSVISESLAIVHYLDAIHPNQQHLFGSTPRERAEIEMWDRRMELELMHPMGMVFRHGNPKMAQAEKQVPAYAESLEELVAQRMERMNTELEGRKYIAGETFSYADITAYISFMFFGKLCGFKPAEHQTHLQRWFNSVAQRPSAEGVLYR